MKFAIKYNPTNEYVSFFDKGKAVLFTNDENKIQSELNDILYSDGGYDGNEEDFSIEVVDFDTNGGEFVKEDDIFVSQSLVK